MTSVFDRIFGRRRAEATPIEASPPVGPELEKQIGWLRDSVRSNVASGFYDEDAILTQARGAGHGIALPTEKSMTEGYRRFRGPF